MKLPKGATVAVADGETLLATGDDWKVLGRSAESPASSAAIFRIAQLPYS